MFSKQYLIRGSYDSKSGNWTVGNVTYGASAKLTITTSVDTGTGALEIDNLAGDGLCRPAG